MCSVENNTITLKNFRQINSLVTSLLVKTLIWRKFGAWSRFTVLFHTVTIRLCDMENQNFLSVEKYFVKSITVFKKRWFHGFFFSKTIIFFYYPHFVQHSVGKFHEKHVKPIHRVKRFISRNFVILKHCAMMKC